jgi:hypothetical protein
MTATFTGALAGADVADDADDVAGTLTFSVDFTVNDGESSGRIGLD